MTDQEPKRPARKIRPDPDLLTPGDFRRARVALGGRDPWEMLGGHQEDQPVLIAWCLLSRDDPTLTFEDVERWAFGQYILGDDEEEQPGRPPEAPSSTNGSGPKRNDAKQNDKPANVSPSSAASTT